MFSTDLVFHMLLLLIHAYLDPVIAKQLRLIVNLLLSTVGYSKNILKYLHTQHALLVQYSNLSLQWYQSIQVIFDMHVLSH